jgi:hypothetical protein
MTPQLAQVLQLRMQSQCAVQIAEEAHQPAQGKHRKELLTQRATAAPWPASVAAAALR